MIKKLSQSIRQYKSTALLTPVLVALEVASEIIIPLLVANLIDLGIDSGNMDAVLHYGALLLIGAAAQFAFGTASGFTAARASTGFASNLRSDMYNNVQTFSFSNIDKFSAASIVTRLTTDVASVQMAFMMITRMAVRSPLMLVFSLAAAFRINAKISLVFFACIPLLGTFLAIIMRHAHPTFRKVFSTYDELNGIVEENLRGIRVVKAFDRAEFEKQKFGSISDKIYKLFVKAERLVMLNMPVMQLCMYGCMLIVSWLGARAIVASRNDSTVGLTTGELMILITYATQILMSLMMLSMIFVMLTMARSAGERIVEILDEKADILNGNAPIINIPNGEIVFDNVTFFYADKSDKPVLQNISLTIPSGSTVGIIGATGSAKSTLVQLIPRLYDVAGGSVKVGSIDVRDYDLTALRDSVAMVLQKNILFSGSVKENLRWGNEDADDSEMIKACRMAQADEFIQSFPQKYDHYIEQGGQNLSGGQKQRLCIARALLKKPKILILDDSTSAVDTATDAKIQAAFAEYIPSTTKIIIAQRISSVQNSDMIIVMDDGKISAVGDHFALLENCEIYREVYQSQKKGEDDNEPASDARS